jgi:predicted regulator of Ras-like GTPase activity (Roadblock/LC7/MglB family)
MVQPMVTRQSELLRVLGHLAEELPQPEWVALVDHNGLIVACVPPEPVVETERISAMTAASVTMGERVLSEIDGGALRYASIAGSVRQHLTVVLSKDRLLSIGLKPEVAPQATFGPLGRWVPELLRALQMRFTAG